MGRYRHVIQLAETVTYKVGVASSNLAVSYLLLEFCCVFEFQVLELADLTKTVLDGGVAKRFKATDFDSVIAGSIPAAAAIQVRLKCCCIRQT